MKVYLDNNIVVSLENNDYAIEKIRWLLPEGKHSFYYSSAHAFEAETFPGHEKIKIQFRFEINRKNHFRDFKLSNHF